MTQELLGRVHRELLDVLNSINQDKIHHDGDDFHELLNDVEKALAQPEQEPCVHAKNPKGCYRVRCQLGDKCVDDEMSFRTSPPQRKPLLASEIVTMYAECPTSDNDMIDFARVIEAAHGRKDNT